MAKCDLRGQGPEAGGELNAVVITVVTRLIKDVTMNDALFTGLVTFVVKEVPNKGIRLTVP